ncbi:MAG: PH domain-containing protein [Bacilli bacterium]|nr:PH domain-containing protein [Bacilli bacterium]
MEILWSEKKKWTFFALPLTFTTYSLTEDKLLIDRGFLNKYQDEIMLYRVLDLTLSRNLIQRMFKLGSIKVVSSDKSCPDLIIKNIYDSQNVKEQLSELVDKARDKKRVFSREIIDDGHHDFDSDVQDWL